MGYTTRFKGTLEFAKGLTIEELRVLNLLLDRDPKHGDSDAYPPEYIGVKVNKELTGLVDNGAEKIYNMQDTLNWLTRKMRERFPDFRLVGRFLCSGEDGAVWSIMLDEQGLAKEVSIDLFADLKAAAAAADWRTFWQQLDEKEKEARNLDYEEDYAHAVKKLFNEARKVVPST